MYIHKCNTFIIILAFACNSVLVTGKNRVLPRDQSSSLPNFYEIVEVV